MRIRNTIWLVVFISLGCLLSGCGTSMMLIHMFQGDMYWGQGKYEEAIAKYQKVIEVDPDIHDSQTQYFGRLHRNHDKDATLIENDPLLQDETFVCIGMHEQLREGEYF